MAKLNPYLTFKDNAEEAFNFYKSVFGGEFVMIMRGGETPMGDKLPANEKNRIMHVSLPIGKNSILMGSDSFESMGHPFTAGNNFSLAVGAESKEDADKLYKALSEGGNAIMPPADQFWGDYFGMLIDKFGIQWMVSYTPPKQ